VWLYPAVGVLAWESAGGVVRERGIRYTEHMSSVVVQTGLFGRESPTVDTSFSRRVRHALEQGSWVDHTPGFVRGHETVFEHLRQHTRWQSGRRMMYDRMVDVPRLLATLPEDSPGHPVLRRAGRVIIDRYNVRIRRAHLLLYRDGSDSVATHSDRGQASVPGAMTITMSFGTPRALHLRAKSGGRTRVFHLGWGDLFVMGPTLQRTHLHGVPKVAHAPPRLAVVFWCHQREGEQ
jgi:alkylated DNA repair dioxygenase AlkB